MFTVTDPRLIDVAVLLMQWPFSYVARRDNVARHLAPHFAHHSGLKTAVDALLVLQTSLSRLSSSESAWRTATLFSSRSNRDGPIHTIWPATEAAHLDQRALEFDLPLFESVSAALHRKHATATRPCSVEDLKVLTQCVWIASHVALCVLGVARAVADGPNVRFEVADRVAKDALIRAWFGVAFDKHSRHTDEQTLEALATSGRLKPADILVAFAKQWRLGVEWDEDGSICGTLARFKVPVLYPSMKLLLASVQLSRQGSALLRTQAREIDCVREFDLIEKHMRSLPIVDRALQSGPAGLARGSLQLVPSLLTMAELIACEKFGVDWHNDLGNELEGYLLTRLGAVAGVRVAPVKLRQDMTATGDIPIDVDLFVIDDRIDRVYAVQCKHLESSHRAGLLDWLERFRRPRDGTRKGLDKAVQQLENLGRLCETDPKVREVLTRAVGLSPRQIDTIRPVVVHNLWNVDFWRTDQGICFYDLHTFCNGIKGREAVVGAIGPADRATLGVVRDNAAVDMSDPDAVIRAYVNDPTWKALAQFDATGRVLRSTTVDGVVLTAEGLGL